MADERPADDDRSAGLGLELDAVQVESLDDERSIVSLTGHWHGDRPRKARAVLIVDALEEQRRFSAIAQRSRDRRGDQDQFSARFRLPNWLLPVLEQDASLAVGEHVVRLIAPTLGVEESSVGLRGEELASSPPEGVPLAASLAASAGASPGAARPHEDHPAVSPAEELRRRAANEARLRGELSELRARLAARSEAGLRLEEMREALRTELTRVRELVGQEDTRRTEIEAKAMVLAAELADSQQQVEELGEELQAARAIAHAAEAEVVGLAAELERLEDKLAVAEAEVDQRESGLEEAESLLVEARELNALLRER